MIASQPKDGARRPLFHGWRGRLARCTGATALVALLNILFLSIAGSNLKPFDKEAEYGDSVPVGGAIFEGSCGKAKEFSLWLHLAINVLSTVLLASGNYAQQMLTAPTRKEIDRAHANQSWLNIGILSYRNLRGISKRRVLAWAVLALTSIPIHLIYNSVVLLETSSNSYSVNLIRENDTSTLPDYFERLENDECISQYAREFLPNRSDLFLVVSSDYQNYDLGIFSAHLNRAKAADPLGWMCFGMPDSCNEKSLKAQPENWKTVATDSDENPPTSVKYCLSKPVEENCRLAMSMPLMGIVVACNLLKLVGLVLTWIFLDAKPLLTLGDAIASFLGRPDPTTASSRLLCIGPRQSIKWEPVSNPWKTHRRRWACFIPPSIYVITIISSVVAMIVTSVLLATGIRQIARDSVTSFAALWDRGFGSIDVECLVLLNSLSPVKTSLLSNTPQLIVSIIYTTVNGMWTAMMVGNEWNGYGLRKKSLRTTAAVGRQRSSYWLSLPLRYGLPLVGASILLHWLISQSIFFVRIIILHDGKFSDLVTQPGYSPIAIIFSMMCGATVMLATIGLSLLPYKTAVPQIGTCSAVLSAACHPPNGDEDAALEEVQWGVVLGQFTDEGDKEERCCVTSWKVEPPIEGEYY